MNRNFLKYVGIGVLVIFAFVLFTNRTNTSYPYRAELRSLKSEHAMTVELFVAAYRQFDTEGSYDLAMMENQLGQLEGHIERYNGLDELPLESKEDYAALLEGIQEEQAYFQLIYETALRAEPIPGEYTLGLKKTVEALSLYQGRMGRY